MLFRQVSRQHNREIENEFHIFFTANFARKRSNLPRKVRYELSRGANCRAKDRSKLPCTVKYRSKDRAVPNNRCCENAANYRDLSRKYRVERNFFEKLRKPGISTKFVCITFVQYCISGSSALKTTIQSSLESLIDCLKDGICCSRA